MYNQYNPWQINQAIKPKIPKFNWSSILNNTQKTLGIINQAIPIVYQVRPLFSNAKTLFKIAGVMRESDETSQEEITNSSQNNSNLQFFL